jgi:hypothetical protein
MGVAQAWAGFVPMRRAKISKQSEAWTDATRTPVRLRHSAGTLCGGHHQDRPDVPVAEEAPDLVLARNQLQLLVWNIRSNSSLIRLTNT